jgi:hypothetical protein
VFGVLVLISSFNIDNITGKIKINSRGLPCYRGPVFATGAAAGKQMPGVR